MTMAANNFHFFSLENLKETIMVYMKAIIVKGSIITFMKPGNWSNKVTIATTTRLKR
jgi:hypothetical protein